MYFFTADNISTSMYIMCVIPCLFSILSCWVGALQISIIIRAHFDFVPLSEGEMLSWPEAATEAACSLATSPLGKHSFKQSSC